MSQIDLLAEIARQAMLDKGLEPDFSDIALKELSTIKPPIPSMDSESIKDLRRLTWFSIDNDDSKDLDQLSYIELLPNEDCKLYVAIADVAILVKKDSAIDQHAEYNTTSVYTPSKVFSMLPEKLSTDLTSLNPNEDRRAIVVETTIDAQGAIKGFDVYPAYVHSYAKLAYNSVAAWLDGNTPPPQPIANSQDLQNQLRIHDAIAKKIKLYRESQGQLSLETAEFQLIISEGTVTGLQEQKKNRARQIIETLMITSNTAATQFLIKLNLPIVRRVVQAPKRWDRIVDFAKTYGDTLPNEPDSKALEQFLIKRKSADPLNFAELSLTIIKSLGRGEYILSGSGEKSAIGHFALALQDYCHITAPNRRYLDLVIQRMLKAVNKGLPAPYTTEELNLIAQHCTQKEIDAEKVERRVKKSAAAMLLSSSIGTVYDGIILGSGEKGTWVKVLNPPIEGKVVKGFEGLDVGNHVRVKLIHIDVKQGFIDFAAEG